MRYKTVVRFADGIAVGLFVEMLNQSNRGENFSWEKFPKMAGCHAKKSLPFHMVDATAEEKEAAEEAAQKWATWAVETAGLTKGNDPSA